jgi:excisionase family DNA binding protein
MPVLLSSAGPAQPETLQFTLNLTSEVMMNGDEILDVVEASTLLRADPETVLQFARKGQLPGTRIGKSWVFLREDVIGFLKGQIARDTEERRRRQTPVSADAVLVPILTNKRRRQLPALPALPSRPANS